MFLLPHTNKYSYSKQFFHPFAAFIYRPPPPILHPHIFSPEAPIQAGFDESSGQITPQPNTSLFLTFYLFAVGDMTFLFSLSYKYNSPETWRGFIVFPHSDASTSSNFPMNMMRKLKKAPNYFDQPLKKLILGIHGQAALLSQWKT